MRITVWSAVILGWVFLAGMLATPLLTAPVAGLFGVGFLVTGAIIAVMAKGR